MPQCEVFRAESLDFMVHMLSFTLNAHHSTLSPWLSSRAGAGGWGK